MKKTLFIILVLLLAAASTSCRKLALNGDFSGQWQILKIEYADGTVVDPEGQYYYCFYRDVAQLTRTGAALNYTANLAYHEDSFTLQFPYASSEPLGPWGLATDPISPLGFSITLTINELTSSRLVMTTPSGTIITCRKF